MSPGFKKKKGIKREPEVDARSVVKETLSGKSQSSHGLGSVECELGTVKGKGSSVRRYPSLNFRSANLHRKHRTLQYLYRVHVSGGGERTSLGK